MASLAAAVWPLTTSAQQARTPVVGFLGLGSPTTVGPALLAAFHRGLAEAGYTDGRNVAVDYVWAEGLYTRGYRTHLAAADRLSRRSSR